MKHRERLFKDREIAAKLLREQLPLEQMRDDAWQLVAVSKGGMIIANDVNAMLKLPLEILISEPITTSQNPESEVARVSELEEIVMHEALIHSFGIKLDYVYGEAHRKYEDKMRSKIYAFRHGDPFPDMAGKPVLLVDEGAESGLTFMTAIKTIINMHPKAVYVAAPVLPNDVLEAIDALVDEVFYVHAIDDYVHTKTYYESLPDVEDETIEILLENNYANQRHQPQD
jgi:putative phosphoribosyl transferase